MPARSEAPGGSNEPTKLTLADYLGEWLDGLQVAPSTLASYRKNVRLHLVPRIGGVKVTAPTGPRSTAL